MLAAIMGVMRGFYPIIVCGCNMYSLTVNDEYANNNNAEMWKMNFEITGTI